MAVVPMSTPKTLPPRFSKSPNMSCSKIISRMNLEFLWDFIFPIRCVSCKKYPEGRAPLCADCALKISVHRTLFCGTCSARLPEGKKICHWETQFILGAAADYGNETVRSLVYAL